MGRPSGLDSAADHSAPGLFDVKTFALCFAVNTVIFFSLDFDTTIWSVVFKNSLLKLKNIYRGNQLKCFIAQSIKAFKTTKFLKRTVYCCTCNIHPNHTQKQPCGISIDHLLIFRDTRTQL